MGNVVITSLLIFTFIFFNTRWCSCKGNSRNSSILKCKPSKERPCSTSSTTSPISTNTFHLLGKVWNAAIGVRVGCDNTTGHILKLHLNGDDSNNLLKMEKLESTVYLLELRQLESLDLSYNDFSYSSIPIFMGSMKQLGYLNLSSSSIGGLVPYELRNLTNLLVLDLSQNNLSGAIPASLGKLSNLKSLDISDNNLSGEISYFSNLSSLKDLDMSETMLTLNLSSDWVPPFQLQTFAANNINGEIPPWLQTQKNLSLLSLSDANISGIMPRWFHTMQQLYFVDLSNNNLSGQIPNSLCQLISLNFLDINNNSLSGKIPNCFTNFSRLSLLRLSYNKLEGHIPCFNNRDSYYSYFGMGFYLHLNDNMLSGEIPSCLSNLTSLVVLDVGRNQLSGKMLKWFSAEKFNELQILKLRGNKFTDTIPRQICCLPHLQIMDLGHNHFTGSIPNCLSNLTAMTSPNASQITDTIDPISEVFQGIERSYTSTLSYLVDIDLSFNNLVGSIPDDMTKISGLLSLNLSYNQLSGTIPQNIGGLESLISLDCQRINSRVVSQQA